MFALVNDSLRVLLPAITSLSSIVSATLPLSQPCSHHVLYDTLPPGISTFTDPFNSKAIADVPGGR